MTVDQLRRAHQTQPFQPFVLRAADGQTYEVRHPELMSFSQSGRTIAVATPDDAHDVLDSLAHYRDSQGQRSAERQRAEWAVSARVI